MAKEEGIAKEEETTKETTKETRDFSTGGYLVVSTMRDEYKNENEFVGRIPVKSSTSSQPPQ
jgi:hypothetical protein